MIAINTLINLSIKVPSGKNIGNITADINKTVIRGTPLQSSIKPIEIYLIAGNDDLRPNAKITPIGKQKSIANAEIIKVNETADNRVFYSVYKKNIQTRMKNKIKKMINFLK